MAVIVEQTLAAIKKNLMALYMSPPTTEDWEKISEDFLKLWQFPNCVGAIDGKHCNIFAEPRTGSLNFNYKKSHSHVLMALMMRATVLSSSM